jgi:NAD(P)-dependent dehydrogenase (short-subunit alcohol dehydrogenase family)
MAASRKILVLGASGLVGRFITDDLRARGFEVLGVARKLSASQKNSPLDLELPIMSMDAPALASLLRDRAIDVVVNCLGVLQDGPSSELAPCIGISLRACCRRSAAPAASSASSTSRSPAPPRRTALPLPPPSARPNG